MQRVVKLLAAFVIVALVAVFLVIEVARSAPAQKIDFAREIEPIFKANCYQCHGPQKAMSQLRLDQQTSALKVITPGNGQESRLLQRVLGLNGEKRMPLNGAALKPEQIESIRKWIDEGANWPESNSQLATLNSQLPSHWAFTAPVRPALPEVRDKSWIRTPVDHFILAKIDEAGLKPSPEATKEQLIRRVSLDLIGLPPSLKELDEFVADRRPDAYERLVERLLASPHYGERWGRWWLDAARYADTNGYEKDRDRPIWPYRDWVIKAFNRDMPFDRFTIEQMAGDLLPQATLEQKIATGFLRNSMLNEEGAVDPEQFRVEGLIDRVDAIGKAFLGMTINCAQCHTHKYDPIKHNEYYKFYAFLNQDEEPEIEVPTAEVSAKRAALLARIEKIEDELLAKNSDLPRRMTAWEEKSKQDVADWVELENIEVTATNGVKFEQLLDRSFIPRGDNPPTGVYYVKAKTDLKRITGFRLELLTDHTLPRKGPGRSTQGNLLLSEFVVEAAPADQPDKFAKVAIADASADFSTASNPIKLAVDGNPKTSWSADAGPKLRNQDRKAVFAVQEPIGFEAGTRLNISLTQKEFGGGAAERFEAPNIGRFRVMVTAAPNPKADPLPAHVRSILAIPAAARSKEQQREVFRSYRTTVPEFAEANKTAADLFRQWPEADATMVLSARPVPRETRVFVRGDWKRQGELVTPDTPSFLHPFPKDAPRNRLGLAQWLVDKKNPLTARVIVNRVWQHYFGAGLVSSPEDFGTRCDHPSHPELLDWLAVELMGLGIGDCGMRNEKCGQPPSPAWSIKHLHRLIVNSAAYRQSSARNPNPALQNPQSDDPTNRLLARAPRIRVEAEAIRDITLAASGLLSRKIGGPSVFPPIPDGAMAVSFRSRTVWETSKGEDRYRRGMYTFWKRSVPYPSMSIFDAPTADMACTRRTRSNSPLQALTTLNDAAFMEAAQALAWRVWKEGGADDRAKLNYLFRLCTSRFPDEVEMRRLLALLEKERARFQGDTAAAVYVTSPDLNNLPPGVDLHQVAPWTIVSRVVLNLDETITKQ